MANSSTVAALQDILASQYNNLRLDVLDLTTGHTHDGTNGRNTGFSLGNATITGTLGGLTLVGIGGIANASNALLVYGTATTGTAQGGVNSQQTFSSGATVAGVAFEASVVTAAAAFTMTTGAAFRANAPVVGANSAITTEYGFYAANQGATGITNAYGVYIAAQSGAATTNIGLYNAGTTTLAGALTVTTGGIAVTGNSAFGASASTVVGLLVSSAQSVGAGADGQGIAVNAALTKTANTGTLVSVQAGSAITVNSAVTCTRATQFLAVGVTATVTGTLTNHNALYLGTPVNGSTVNVIDSAAGATLPSTGIWTNAPSFKAYKDDVRYVPMQEIDGLLDWMADGWKAARYRHKGRALGEDGPAPIHQDYEYDSFFALLDDMPQNVREIICADAKGGISTKDTDGFALALIAASVRRIQQLESRLAAAGIN